MSDEDFGVLFGVIVVLLAVFMIGMIAGAFINQNGGRLEGYCAALNAKVVDNLCIKDGVVVYTDK